MADEIETLRAENKRLRSAELAASVLGDDVFNLTEKVIPAIREERDKLVAENERLRQEVEKQVAILLERQDDHEDAELFRYMVSGCARSTPDDHPAKSIAGMWGEDWRKAINEAMKR